ncbi:MAG: RluA family pseudouridine synthase [Desulfobacterales bacterium]|nr:RluA family pseudouridine synthase [Desulfobacterales bacterium]
MPSNGVITLHVKPSDEGQRLDVFVASQIAGHTRSFVAGLIGDRHFSVNGQPKKPGYRIKSGDTISGIIPPPAAIELKAEPLSLDVVFEDEAIIVVNKQPGLVVHPAPGHNGGTLVNGLLHHCADLGGIGGKLRPGIVHRLDKDTSGTLVVAKNDLAHTHLARQFKSRQVEKKYLALVHGVPRSPSGTIQLPIGRHPANRKRMSTVSRSGRTAETQWAIEDPFEQFALLKVTLKTGRTHQIRVHCAAMQHPIVGDRVYRPRKLEKTIKRGCDQPDKILQVLKSARRQMLHAWQLGFTHPQSGQWMSFESALPEDMAQVLKQIKEAGL